MLRYKTCSKHFDALARNFLDDGRIVHESPATERHQVVELSRQDAEFMLVLAAQHTDEKAIGRKIAAKIFETAQICPADGIAAQTQSRINLFANTNHEESGSPSSRHAGTTASCSKRPPTLSLGNSKVSGNEHAM